MAEGQRSLLAPWLGGASSAPAATGNGGQRSMLAPWMGGASGGGIAPTTNGGVRSLFAFWMGGAGAGVAYVPPTGGGIEAGYALWSRARRRELEELEAAERRVIEELATQPAAEIKSAFALAGLLYRDEYADLLAFQRWELKRLEQIRLEEEAIVMTMFALLSR